MKGSRLARATAAMAAWSATHRGVVLVGAVAVAALSVFLVARAPFSTSLAAMLGDSTPSAAALARIAGRHGEVDDMLVLASVRDGATPADAARAELLRFAERFEVAVKNGASGVARSVRYRVGESERAYVRDVLLPAGAFFLSDDGFERLLDRLRPEEMRRVLSRGESLISAPGPAAGALAKNLLRDPLRLAELIDEGLGSPGADGDFSPDGRTLLVRVSGERPSGDLEFSSRLTQRVRTLAEDSAGSRIAVEFGGSYAIAAYTSGVIRADSIRATLISIGLLLLVFVVFYRAVRAPLAICVTAGVGILAGFGVYSAAGWSLTPLTAVVGAVLAGLGVDYGVHFVSNYRAQQAPGVGAACAARRAMLHVGPATTANCVTSVAGFVAVGPSGIAALRDFSLIGMLGLGGSLLAVFLLMPALATWAGEPRAPRRTGRVAGAIADVCSRRPRAMLGAGLALVIACVAAGGLGGFAPTLGTDLTVLHPRPNPPLDATEWATRTFASRGEVIAVEVRARDTDELVGRAHAAARAASALRAAGVRGVAGLPGVLPDPAVVRGRAARLLSRGADAAVADFDAAVAGTAFDPSAFGEYRGFLRRLIAARPPTPDDLRRFPEVAGRVLSPDGEGVSTVLAVRFGSPLSDRADRDAAVVALRAALATVPGATATGMSVIGYDLEQATRAALPRSLAISGVLVVVSLLVFLRGARAVLLALVPLGVGALATGAVIVAGRVPLNPVNAAGLPLLAGIAVDAGVYIVAAAREHRPGAPWLHATLHAVLAASVTTITGFASLLWTHTPAVRSLGMLTSIGVLAALASVVLILIPLLALMRSRGVRV